LIYWCVHEIETRVESWALPPASCLLCHSLPFTLPCTIDPETVDPRSYYDRS
jgi:hypothetical protein